MKTTQMDELPKCDMPNCNKEAAYDEKTKMGPWAHLCEDHHQKVGVGVGTKLEKRVKIDAPRSAEIPTVMIPLTLDSLVTIQCPHCGEGRDVESDANYPVTCENCGNQYRVASQI